MRRMKLSLLAITLAGAAAACATQAESTTRLEGTAESVALDIYAGDVTIDGSGSGEVEVSASIDGDVTPTIDLTDGVLTISDDCEAEGCRIDYVVSVPGGADLAVTSATGNIVIRDNVGTLSLATGDGGISLFTVEGDIDVSTGTGDIVGTRVTAATAWFTAGSGTIDVSFAAPVSDLAATTGSGNVTAQLDVSVPYSIVAEATGDVSLGVDSDEAAENQVTLTTGDGNITVYRN